jgi:hypothetical protein
MATRSPEDVLAGVLRIAVGGVEKIVPTLPIKATREWQAAIGSRPSTSDVAERDDWTATDAREFVGLTFDALLDIVTAYDRSAALGGREWLEEHADPAQLHAAAAQMAEVAFPFADSPRVVLAALIVRSVAGSRPPSSTNGPSPIGASTPGPSKAGSTGAS